MLFILFFITSSKADGLNVEVDYVCIFRAHVSQNTITLKGVVTPKDISVRLDHEDITKNILQC